jgi:hypothetical protein
MRWQSAGFVIAMIIGGLLYDPRIINFLLPASIHLSTEFVHRLPVALVLCQALVCLFITSRMIEPVHTHPNASESIDENATTLSTIKSAVRLTLDTTRWLLTHPTLVVLLLIGVALDSIVRNFATINSSYFRLIDLPEWTYGFIGAGMGLLGWFVPALAKKLNERFGMLANLGFTTIGILMGLIALIPAWPIYGVLPAIFLMAMMGFLGFTLSRVLNEEAESSRRATVLSVKGLVFNLGYGLFSLGFSVLLANFPDQPAGTALRSALVWQIPYFVIAMIALFTWANIYLRRRTTV